MGSFFHISMLFAWPGDASMSLPGSKSIAAPKQVIGFTKMKIIKNMKIFKKAQKTYSQGSKFIEKMSKIKKDKNNNKNLI